VTAYLDHAAATPLDPRVRAAVEPFLGEHFASASGVHEAARAPHEALEHARERVAALIGGAPEEIIFTSGATESVHLALLGAAAQHPPGRLVISAVEHPAVEAAAHQLLQRGWTVARWPVDSTGMLQLDQLASLLAPPTRLVSLIWGQSEVGTVQPLLTVAAACRERGIVIHTDATQLLPHGLIDWSAIPVDLLTCSAHKLQGPRGVGLLLQRDGLIQQPLQGGGGQEGGLRAGTEPVALIGGFAEAISTLPRFDPLAEATPPGSTAQLSRWRNRLQEGFEEIRGVTVLHAESAPRLPHHLACLVTTAEGVPLSGRRLVRELARRHVACSSGSACRSGTVQDSAVLTAMEIAPPLRQSLLRFSLGSWIDPDLLDQVPERLQLAIQACA